MKKIFLFITAAICSMAATAQLNGNGYYRVQNFKTHRYVYVCDNKGKLDYGSTTADMAAIKLWKGFDKASSDPASVCYIEKNGDKYDIKAQGTGVYEIIDSYVNIRANKSDGTFYAYGSKDGIVKYLSDGEQADRDEGVMSDAGKGDYKKWFIMPMNTTDNYFGIKPTVAAGGAHYSSFYTAFPYSFASSGMTAYYVFKIINGFAVMREIKGVVPAYSPVIVKMASDMPQNNKLNIGGSGSAISGNMLKGVFFNNPSKLHYNRVAYDKATMRMLDVNADGKMAFVTAGIDFIPANHAYLKVPAGSPEQLVLVTEEEYEQMNAKKPESIVISESEISVTEGEKHQLSATVMPEDAFDKSIAWSTENSGIAIVDGNGVVTGVKAGTTNIVAKTANGITAKCAVTVKLPVQPESIVLSEEHVHMVVGQKHQLTATVGPDNAHDKSVTWGSNDKSIAVMDNDGVITALKAGVVRVLGSTVNGITAYCEVVVTDSIKADGIILSEDHVTMFVGEKHKLTATITPESVTDNRVFWGSNDNSIASMDEDGVITAKKEGVVRVLAWTENGIAAFCEVVVKRVVNPTSIVLDRHSLDIETGMKVQLKAIIGPDDVTHKEVQWTSNDSGIASVDADGVVTGIAPGAARITATTVNGLKSSCMVNVSAGAGIDGIVSDGMVFPVRVYSVDGRLVLTAVCAQDLDRLLPGVYIISGRKFVVTD